MRIQHLMFKPLVIKKCDDGMRVSQTGVAELLQ